MPRARTGSAVCRRGYWYWQIRLRDGRSYARRVPDRANGGPITERFARTYAEEKQRLYDLGAWDPSQESEQAGAEQGAAGAPEPSAPEPETLIAYALAWIGKQTYTTVLDDRRRLEGYLAGTTLGARSLDAVKASDVAGWVRELQLRPSRRGGRLAARTVLNAYDVVRRALAGAVFEERLTRNPCELLPPGGLPKVEDKDPEARARWSFTRTEVEILLGATELPPERRVLWSILLLTGARFGEVAALRWRHFEPDLGPLGRLLVARSIERESRVEKSTKAKRPRQVPVHPVLAKVLAAWKIGGWARVYGGQPKADDLLCPDPTTGEPWSVKVALKRFYKDLRAVGLRRLHLHCTRRTFISLARDDGARGEILRWITHGPSRKEMVDVYSSLSWETFCTEVSKLRLRPSTRQVVALAQGGGERGLGGNANPNATNTTVRREIDGKKAESVVPETGVEPVVGVAIRSIPGDSRRPAQQNATDRDGSATRNANTPGAPVALPGEPMGALSGEVMALAWCDRVLAEEALLALEEP